MMILPLNHRVSFQCRRNIDLDPVVHSLFSSRYFVDLLGPLVWKVFRISHSVLLPLPTFFDPDCRYEMDCPAMSMGFLVLFYFPNNNLQYFSCCFFSAKDLIDGNFYSVMKTRVYSTEMYQNTGHRL